MMNLILTLLLFMLSPSTDCNCNCITVFALQHGSAPLCGKLVGARVWCPRIWVALGDSFFAYALYVGIWI